MKVLITDHVHPFLVDFFERKNFDVNYRPSITSAEVHDCISPYHILIVNSKIKIQQVLIEKAKTLKIVGRLGSGMDGIDVVSLNKNKIHVVRTPEANANAVTEHAMGMLLSLCNNLVQADNEVRESIWHREKLRGIEIENLVLGIVGFGHVGSLFARKMSAWSQTILCYDKYLTNYSKEFYNIDEVSIEKLQEHADIISLHVPLNDETHHWIDKRFIDNCKPGVIIINTSRGGIIKTEDLIDGIESGQIKGACLDVFENEKPQTYSVSDDQVYKKLYSLPNVVVSPHIAGWTVDSFFKISKVMSEKIDKLLGEM